MTNGERRYWRFGKRRVVGGASRGRVLLWRVESADLELSVGMSWWPGVLRSVWSSFSREVRVHVGTDHLGNKYYYIAEYKNWRGESEEPLPVATRPRRVLGGRASGVLVPDPGPRVWWLPWVTKSGPRPPRSARGSGEHRERLCASALPWSSDLSCPQSLQFSVAQWLARSPYLSPSLST